MREPKTILGVGRPTLELLGTVHRLPSPGGSSELSQFSIQGSGAVTTALVALLEWGHRCRLAGRVSDDSMGHMILSGLAFDGFDSSGLVVTPGCVSPFAFVALAEGEGPGDALERTLFHTAGTLPPLGAGEVDLGLVDGCHALLIDGSEPEAELAAAEAAQAAGVPVFFNAGRETATSERLLAHTTVLIASERFAAEMAPHPEVPESLARLRARGPNLAIVKMGIDGSIGLGDTAPIRQPIFDGISTRERGGAGHIFFAGVTHGILRGWTLDRVLRFATAAAGLSCREIGSLGGIPSLPEVEGML